MDVLFVHFDCCIGDIYQIVSDEDVALAKKIELHEIELSDYTAVYIGDKANMNILIDLLERNKRIIKEIQEIDMLRLDSDFNLTQIDKNFLIEFLIDNTELDYYLDKISKTGMNSISKVEFKVIESLSR